MRCPTHGTKMRMMNWHATDSSDYGRELTCMACYEANEAAFWKMHRQTGWMYLAAIVLPFLVGWIHQIWSARP